MLGVVLLLQVLTVAVPDPPTSAEYLPIRAAAAFGDFAREGLDVRLRAVRSEAAAAESLARNEVDLAGTTVDSVLRFGSRLHPLLPRVVFGLTAAPPVTLVAARAAVPPILSIEDLRGRRIAVAAPGAPERAWLASLLTAPPGPSIRVNSISVGPRGAAGALADGTADAALAADPDGSDLVEAEHAILLADLRDPAAARRAIGRPTLNAAVFIGPDRALAGDTLERLGRALVAAERRLASAEIQTLAGQLPAPVVGVPAEFARRIEAAGRMYLPDGHVEPDRLAATIELVRAHLPLPPSLKIPPADELILTGRLEPR